MVEFEKEIFKKAVVLGIYLKGRVIRWLFPEQLDFTDLGNVIYWDGRAWIRMEKNDVVYLIIPKNILDLFPKAEIIGEIELEWIRDDHYITTIPNLERTITNYYRKLIDNDKS